MLRIAMITDYPCDDDRIDGGVQAVTKYLVAALTRQPGIELHVISFRYGIETPISRTHEGFTLHELPGASLGTLTGFRREQQSLDHCLAGIGPDLVHGQGVGRDGILAARSGYPRVLTVHGILREEARHFEGLGRRLRHLLQNRISQRWCIRKATHTILISSYVDAYLGNTLAGSRYFVPNPVAADFFEIRRAEQRGTILFAGRLHRLKGVVNLVRAAASCVEKYPIRVVLAGSTTDRDYVRLLQDEAARTGLDDRLEIRGILDAETLRQELSRAAMLVLPSFQETAPMVIQEAMAAGVPVIASRVGGTGEQVEHGVTGFLVEPGDTNGLAEKIEKLLSNDNLRASVSVAARKRAEARYRSDRVAEETVRVYEQVLSRQSGIE